MQRRKIAGIIGLFIVLFFGASCKKDSKADPSVRTRLSTYVEKDGKNIVYVTDLPGDIAASPGAPAKTVYFSFTSNNTVDSSQKKSASWDVSFGNIYNSYVTINNGANPMSPGYGGSTQGALYIVNQPFDSVKTVPAGTEVNVNGSAGMDGYPSASWPGWYQYNSTTHLLTPIQARTLVIKMANGKYAKLQMISLYKGNPVNPTLSTPVPYITFKYWVQQDGSTNLQIP
ncbi:MAG: HmuY family protein [Chitinophagaceae bacterium]|nr:HmuY family protein [Chitinophagaceae bacterium]